MGGDGDGAAAALAPAEVSPGNLHMPPSAGTPVMIDGESSESAKRGEVTCSSDFLASSANLAVEVETESRVVGRGMQRAWVGEACGGGVPAALVGACAVGDGRRPRSNWSAGLCAAPSSLCALGCIASPPSQSFPSAQRGCRPPLQFILSGGPGVCAVLLAQKVPRKPVALYIMGKSTFILSDACLRR